MRQRPESQLHARVSQEALNKLSKMAPHRRKGEFVEWLICRHYEKLEKRGMLVPNAGENPSIAEETVQLSA